MFLMTGSSSTEASHGSVVFLKGMSWLLTDVQVESVTVQRLGRPLFASQLRGGRLAALSWQLCGLSSARVMSLRAISPVGSSSQDLCTATVSASHSVWHCWEKPIRYTVVMPPFAALLLREIARKVEQNAGSDTGILRLGRQMRCAKRRAKDVR